MNLILKRLRFQEDGIFGHLYDDEHKLSLQSLEHAYPLGGGGYWPKVARGPYRCVRGIHQLPHKPQSFETFELLDVPGHSGILFHVGNFNRDSDGCILLGRSYGQSAIYESWDAFKEFMDFMAGINEFNLFVSDYLE